MAAFAGYPSAIKRRARRRRHVRRFLRRERAGVVSGDAPSDQGRPVFGTVGRK